MKRYFWGILGTGHIASKFVEGLSILPQARIYAVASRSEEKACKFASQYGFEKHYDSYQELLRDKNVDIVYVATPNHLHYPLTVEALKCGKAVLCEKPLGLNPEEVKKMNELSKETHCFLMEAMWSAFLPSISMVRRVIKEGMIGSPKFFKAEFGIHPDYNPDSRLFNPKMGGGVVYDIGIYTLYYALALFGIPKEISSIAHLAPTGVDITSHVSLKYEDGKMAFLTSTFACDMMSDASIVGEKGIIRIDRMFHMPTKLFVLNNLNGKEKELPISYDGNGYNYEAAEVMKCMDKGKIESDIYSHTMSLELSKLISLVINQSKL